MHVTAFIPRKLKSPSSRQIYNMQIWKIPPPKSLHPRWPYDMTPTWGAASRYWSRQLIVELNDWRIFALKHQNPQAPSLQLTLHDFNNNMYFITRHHYRRRRLRYRRHRHHMYYTAFTLTPCAVVENSNNIMNYK